MTEAQIRQKIQYYNEQGALIRRSIRKLEQQHDELTELRSRYEYIQDCFVSRQRKRVTALHKSFTKAVSLNMIKSYVIGMEELLNGAEYKETVNGINDAIEGILRKRREIQRRMDNEEQQYELTLRQVNYWETELQKVQMRALEGG